MLFVVALVIVLGPEEVGRRSNLGDDLPVVVALRLQPFEHRACGLLLFG